MKIGVITDCMKMKDLDSALRESKKLGVSGVQIYATGGEFSPSGLTQEKKEYYKNLLKELNLEDIESIKFDDESIVDDVIKRLEGEENDNDTDIDDIW